LKKEAKTFSGWGAPRNEARPSNKSFLVLFCKKELLFFLP
jgi:hypothetical protein